MAPKDENELRHMVKTAFETGHPTSIRYPRGEGFGVAKDEPLRSLPLGKGEVLREGRDVAIFAIGVEAWPSLDAAEILAKDGIDAAVINARFIKPLDDELILRYCKPGMKIVTVEEGSIAGGFGAAVMEKCVELGVSGVEFHAIGIPDVYVSHGSQPVLRAQYDLHPEGIANRTKAFVRRGESVPRAAS